ncbi:hypothetical protein UA74_11155 [Actinoalloteichus fjordicus]|uniref:Uncharacterized protein n=1 Tax=Actinoalloteichus fjordicus TaxID=1612552 RepID=A0AAC9LBH8_9PSEU|nr:hypothetical protein UA74_11155 [Actinoalloteichus fjordicus]
MSVIHEGNHPVDGRAAPQIHTLGVASLRRTVIGSPCTRLGVAPERRTPRDLHGPACDTVVGRRPVQASDSRREPTVEADQAESTADRPHHTTQL